MNQADAILIVGATGVVGQQLVRLLRQRHPRLPLLLAARTLAAAERLAVDVGYAQALTLDVQRPQPLGELRPRAILALVNDPHDHLLQAALCAGIAYLDITRWSQRLQHASEQVRATATTSPVLLASGWMAGLIGSLAQLAIGDLPRLERIDLSVLYALQDRSGPDSVEYMARLATPFTVQEGGRPLRVKPYSDPRSQHFPGGLRRRVYRFDTPDGLILPGTTGALSVSARIAFDDRLSMPLLIALGRSGLWRLISGPRFKAWRHALLHNPGAGAAHEVVIELQGRADDGQLQHRRLELSDPQGQTHLTAVGALLQLERLLGLDGAPPLAAGLHHPHSALSLAALVERLNTYGISVRQT